MTAVKRRVLKKGCFVLVKLRACVRSGREQRTIYMHTKKKKTRGWLRNCNLATTSDLEVIVHRVWNHDLLAWLEGRKTQVRA